jgi:hypothetical protein
MLCRHCNATISNDARFCTSCGQAVVVAPVPPTRGKPNKTLLFAGIGIFALLLIAAGVGVVYFSGGQQAQQASDEIEDFSQKTIREMEEESRRLTQETQEHHEATSREIRDEEAGVRLSADKWAKVEQIFVDALECRKELPWNTAAIRPLLEKPNHRGKVVPPADFRLFGLPVTKIGTTLNYDGGEGIYYSAEINGYTFDQIAKAANLKISQEHDESACSPDEDECYENAPLIWVGQRETRLIGTTGELGEDKNNAWLTISVQPEKRYQQKSFDLTCYIYYPAP